MAGLAGRRRIVLIIWLAATGATATWAPFRGGWRRFIFFPGHYGSLDPQRLLTEWVAIGAFCCAVLLLPAGWSVRRLPALRRKSKPQDDIEPLQQEPPPFASPKESRWLHLPLSAAYKRLRWRLVLFVVALGLIPPAVVFFVNYFTGSTVTATAAALRPNLAKTPPDLEAQLDAAFGPVRRPPAPTLASASAPTEAQFQAQLDAAFGPKSPAPPGWTRKGIVLINNADPRIKVPVQQWDSAPLATTLTPSAASAAAQLAAERKKANALLDAAFPDVAPQATAAPRR